MSREVLAPGKLVLLGEYAVVDGAPAVVLAVDSGVRCSVTPGPFCIEAPDDAFVGPALRAAKAPPARYHFRTHNPPPTGVKAGLGGSAAATVAAVFAARVPADHTPTQVERAEIGRIAAAVHHQVQGSGSGVDVAASIWGGTLRFQQGRVRPLPPCTPVVIWSGRAARTGPRVTRYLQWGGRAPFIAAMTSAVARFEHAPIEAMTQAGALLQAMAHSAGVDYLTPALQRIIALAADHGGVAKPSGAGGGDCAVALLPDPDAKQRFIRACDQADLLVLKLAPAAGVHQLVSSVIGAPDVQTR